MLALNVPSRMKTLQSLSGSETYWINVEALVLDLADLTAVELVQEEEAIKALVPLNISSRVFERAMADTSAYGPGRRSFWNGIIDAQRAVAVAA